MLSRHKRPWDPEQYTAAAQLRREVEDAFGDNLVSAQRTSRIINAARESGVRDFQRIPKWKGASNLARNMKRNKAKNRFWLDTYVFSCPVWNRKKNGIVKEDVAVWLPAEILEMLWKLGDPNILLSTANMDAHTKAHHRKVAEDLGLSSLWGVALHGDGVPNNYDRTESSMIISISLPGLGGKWARMRIPLAVLPSQKICDETLDAILEVFAWSFRHSAAGTRPAERHDRKAGESPWRASAADRKRAASFEASSTLPFNATLVEVRGDWEFYSKVLHFPYHSELDGICWLCNCRRRDISQVDADAPWRKPENRFDTERFINSQLSRGKGITALFSIPGVTNDIIRVDWLHIVDKGVASDFEGNLLLMILRKLPGTKAQKLQAVWEKINEFGDTLEASGELKDRLKKLTWERIREKSTDAPKLSGCNAATLRGFIKVSDLLAKHFLDDAVPTERAAKAAAAELLKCLECLRDGEAPGKLQTAAQAFAVQYKALRDASADPDWRIKPKMHLFMEMVSFTDQPQKTWTYRDEDFGGLVARQSRMKGSWKVTKSFTQHGLDLFAFKNPEPRIVSLI